MRRCTRCVLPETYPEISFDKQGVCNYCQTWTVPISPLGPEKLDAVLQHYRKGNGQLDCLVACSGGRDSSFVLFELKERWGMHPLVFNYANGFVASQAEKNLEHLTRKMNVPLLRVESKRHIQEKMFKSFMALNAQKSRAHVLNQLCVGCRNGIWGGAFKVAAEQGLELVVFGESNMESMVFRRILARQLEPDFTAKIKSTISMPGNFVQRKIQEQQLNREFPLHSEKYKHLVKLNYFAYIGWDETKILETLDAIGWQAIDRRSAWRFDCQIHALGNFLNRQLYQFTEKDELYSKMICAGIITRAEALDKIRLSQAQKEQELATIASLFEKSKIKESLRDKVLGADLLQMG